LIVPEPPIKPAAHDFKEMFEVGTFRVPRYQRAFDWDGDQVGDFARDVVEVVQARLKGSSSRHFFGAVISIHEHQSAFEIVDGQQRLTTYLLSLKELRDRWLQLGEAARTKKKQVSKRAFERAEEVQQIVLIGPQPRLELSKRDKDYFADLINDSASEPKSTADQSHKHLWKAQTKLREDLFDRLLSNVTQLERRQDRLEAIQNALLKDGYVVHLNTTDGDEAYRLFMVLNDRGKPLSAGDLLRTYTLAVLEGYPPQQDAAERDWDVILRRGERFVNRFLAAYYSSHTGTRVPTGEMYDRFRKRFLKDPIDTAQAAKRLRDTISELLVEAETFASLINGDWPFEKAHKPAWDQDRLRRLVKSLGHRLADPLLLVVARRSTETSFRDLVRMLEPFAFRYIDIVSANAGRVEGVYFKHAKRLRGSGNFDKQELRRELKDLLQRYARDEIFIPQLEEQLRFSSSRTNSKKLIKHFLTTLEDHEEWFKKGAQGRPQVKDKTKVFDLDTVNIEHVYPQNPSKEEPMLNPLKHTLGNLTALDQNEGSIAGNKEFPDKKAIYRSSEFKITKPLGRLQKWDQERIRKRVEFYTQRAVKIFVVT
jgi:hypothetical protein